MVEAIAEEESHILHALLKQIYQHGEAVFKVPGQNNDRLTQYLLNKYKLLTIIYLSIYHHSAILSLYHTIIMLLLFTNSKQVRGRALEADEGSGPARDAAGEDCGVPPQRPAGRVQSS